MVKDNAEGIASISWTAYGKIRQIVKGDSVVISYTYDPSGNRISKAIIKSGSTDTARTWYVRDAQGNVMSVYEAGKSSLNDGHLSQTELHLYGGGRIGLLQRTFDVASDFNPADTSMLLLGTGYNVSFGRGNKLFQLSNHLGNVLVAVNDKKLSVSSNNSTVDYFYPQVVRAQDYYPFGMLQPGRVFNTSGYRYGFNGKEDDNEVKGDGMQQDYGLRVYDPRLGRFLSIDPMTKGYPWYTPYQFAGNKPINSVDLDGAEEFETYGDYKEKFGDKAMSKDKWDGSDGAWLKSDRENKLGRWSTAMSKITENLWTDRFQYFGSDVNDTYYPYKITRDYYFWCQKQVDNKGWLSRWAMGASYLVDELADTYQAEGSGVSVMSGHLTPTTTKLGRGILKDLNIGIARLAVERFHAILYGKEMNFTNSEWEWYRWDKDFIQKEQSGKTSPAYEVYSHYNGTKDLKEFNKLSRQSGMFAFGISKHFFPSFALFNGDITNKDTEWDVKLRINLPLMMLYPLDFQFWEKKAESRFKTASNPIGVGHAGVAGQAIDQWHQKQMKY